ncbi:transcriptional regulator, HxlR family [Campylobacter pinnipediorum subsp. pinnipediorum]|uniref:Transcriptional regulator n=1 Tax=Campylobacter pinnipediorum subsp. pinnipediorum TaxID=1660067 RepID=A0AAX0L8P1_9BACT|nr:helix-turn-helix domain-containing protein [Campylobacter pinnipediorum]AQW80824.1 transcriptional regulator, HxlR family [Campylobacter pinnipediorum subsp. pinnipediorum]OPA74826.1 transcriptional regulator [Campylobacter pinnipediorum subsp. pinnipediorum]
MYTVNEKEYKCPVSITLDVFNDRWKLAIIWYLLDGKKRFKELHNNIGEITQKTLTVKLKELEEKNIITRTVYAQVPPKVEYSLTPIGQKLQLTLDEMYKWGLEYVKDNGKILDDTNASSKKCQRSKKIEEDMKK